MSMLTSDQELLTKIKNKHEEILTLKSQQVSQPSISFTDELGYFADLKDFSNALSGELLNTLNLNKEESDTIIKTAELLRSKFKDIESKEKINKVNLKIAKSQLAILISEVENKETLSKLSTFKYASTLTKHFNDYEMDLFLTVLNNLNIKYIKTQKRVCFLFDYPNGRDVRDVIQDHFASFSIQDQMKSCFLKFKSVTQASSFDFSKTELLVLLDK